MNVILARATLLVIEVPDASFNRDRETKKEKERRKKKKKGKEKERKKGVRSLFWVLFLLRSHGGAMMLGGEMPRKPRFYLTGVPVHVVQRGNNRQAIFFADGDYAAYLNWLKEGAERYGCRVHAYVLMTNHVHLLLTPDAPDSVSRTVQHVGRRYVPYVNQTYQRSGTLWEGRYKASTIDSEHYLLVCMRYIELNPVRAKMVVAPGDYPWSSYQTNAYAKKSELLEPHTLYMALGSDGRARRKAYRGLFRSHLDKVVVDEIRNSWQTGTPLGSDHFRGKVGRALKIKVGHARRGRPRSSGKKD